MEVMEPPHEIYINKKVAMVRQNPAANLMTVNLDSILAAAKRMTRTLDWDSLSNLCHEQAFLFDGKTRKLGSNSSGYRLFLHSQALESKSKGKIERLQWSQLESSEQEFFQHRAGQLANLYELIKAHGPRKVAAKNVRATRKTAGAVDRCSRSTERRSTPVPRLSRSSRARSRTRRSCCDEPKSQQLKIDCKNSQPCLSPGDDGQGWLRLRSRSLRRPVRLILSDKTNEIQEPGADANSEIDNNSQSADDAALDEDLLQNVHVAKRNQKQRAQSVPPTMGRSSRSDEDTSMLVVDDVENELVAVEPTEEIAPVVEPVEPNLSKSLLDEGRAAVDEDSSMLDMDNVENELIAVEPTEEIAPVVEPVEPLNLSMISAKTSQFNPAEGEGNLGYDIFNVGLLVATRVKMAAEAWSQFGNRPDTESDSMSTTSSILDVENENFSDGDDAEIMDVDENCNNTEVATYSGKKAAEVCALKKVGIKSHGTQTMTSFLNDMEIVLAADDPKVRALRPLKIKMGHTAKTIDWSAMNGEGSLELLHSAPQPGLFVESGLLQVESNGMNDSVAVFSLAKLAAPFYQEDQASENELALNQTIDVAHNYSCREDETDIGACSSPKEPDSSSEIAKEVITESMDLICSEEMFKSPTPGKNYPCWPAFNSTPTHFAPCVPCCVDEVNAPAVEVNGIPDIQAEVVVAANEFEGYEKFNDMPVQVLPEPTVQNFLEPACILEVLDEPLSVLVQGTVVGLETSDYGIFNELDDSFDRLIEEYLDATEIHRDSFDYANLLI